MDTIKNFQNRIDQELKDFSESLGGGPEELYDPIAYTLSLGGKRMRPLLVLLGCDLFGNAIEPAINPALAVEIFHNFTLLHDDIMDEAPLRRNQPTVHRKWNNNTAILSGDAMMVKAYQLISQYEGSKLSQVLSVFNKTALEVCEGQQMDMNYETKNNVSIENYLEMIQLKTAVLLAGSLKIGAIIGGASSKDAVHLYEFGRDIGIAFQLQDDILDVYGNPEKFGKQVGGDIISNKKTFLLLKAMELAKGEVLAALNKQLNAQDFDPEEKVRTVKEIYDQLQVREFAEQEMERYFLSGLKQLDFISADKSKLLRLKSFSENLMAREF